LVSKLIRLGALDPYTHKPVMQRCILFSLSIDSNPVFSCIPEENLGKADMISGYTDSKLKEIWDEMKIKKRLFDKCKLEMQIYTQMSELGLKDDFDSLPLEMQQWLEELDFKPPTPKCKYPQGVIYQLRGAKKKREKEFHPSTPGYPPRFLTTASVLAALNPRESRVFRTFALLGAMRRRVSPSVLKASSRFLDA